MPRRNSWATLFSNGNRNMNNSRTGMKVFIEENIIRDYGFLNCRNELSSLAIVIAMCFSTSSERAGLTEI